MSDATELRHEAGGRLTNHDTGELFPSPQAADAGRWYSLPMPSRSTPWLRLLPLLLLAVMLAVGFGIEAVVYDEVTWLTKLPLLAMLALAFVRGLR